MREIKDMPKVELHCHLDGSMRVDTIAELLKEQKIDLAEYGLSHEKILSEGLTQYLQVAPDCTSLTEYLQKFDLPLRCLQTTEGLKRAAYELVCDAAKENVKYIEVRFAPMLSTEQGLTCSKVIEAVVEGLRLGEEESGTYARAIVCAMRHHSLEQNMEMLHSAKEFIGKGVCALDLAGDESQFPTKLFRELFAEAKRIGMPFTIHSGECGSVENVREAIELGAGRIGHGISLEKSEELQRLCAEKRIGVEMCPASNLQTKAVESLSQYPIKQFLANGLLVSLNTDNRTVSVTSMMQETQTARDVLGLSEEEILQCTRNAIETAFAEEEVKQHLYQLL